MSQLRRSARDTRSIRKSSFSDEDDHQPTTVSGSQFDPRSPLIRTRNSKSNTKKEPPSPQKKFKLSDLSQLPLSSTRVRSQSQRILDESPEESQNQTQNQTQTQTQAQAQTQTTSLSQRLLSQRTISPINATLSIEARTANHDSRLWQDKYQPESVSQVALHARKLKDIKEQFLPMLNNDTATAPRILVFSGPSGSSKSTIAKSLSHELLPTTTPSFIEFLNPLQTRIDDFEDFLNAAKYHIGKSKRFIIVEDLPNVHHDETRLRFQKALMNWCQSPQMLELPPLIICLTECELNATDDSNEERHQYYGVDSSFTAETVLGMPLMQHYRVQRIKFNPVNFTLCKKFLNEIVAREKDAFRRIKKEPLKKKVEELAQCGDIRSAIAGLQFWSQYLSTESSDIEKHLDLHFGKEQPMNYFHAIGKILHGSKNEDETDADSINLVTEQFLTRSSVLKLGILENYDKSTSMDLKTAAAISGFLSWQDQFPGNNILMDLSCRSTRITIAGNTTLKRSSSSLSDHTVTSIASFPREFKSLRSQRQIRQEIQQYQSLEFKRRKLLRSFQDSNLLFGHYEPIINNGRKFKDKAKLSYLRFSKQSIPLDLLLQEQGKSAKVITQRLGGPLMEIHADSRIPTSGEGLSSWNHNTNYYIFNPQQESISGNGEDFDGEDANDDLEDDPIEESGDEDPGEVSLMMDTTPTATPTPDPQSAVNTQQMSQASRDIWLEREERRKRKGIDKKFLEEIDFDDDFDFDDD